MMNRNVSNVKLGVFVLSGLLFLVLLLYMIGRNSNLFGNTYVLKVRFRNIQGLVVGNNVRYAGIETGTVKKIEILNDTVIEVTMIIDEEMKTVIRKNSLATIGNEGLVGNKVINILPADQPEGFAVENDLLPTYPSVDTDEMLQTLQRTNGDIAKITFDIKQMIHQMNSSDGLWSLVNDKSIPKHIKASVSNLHEAAVTVNAMSRDLNSLTASIKNGEGSIGVIITDTSFAYNIANILGKMQIISDEADSLVKSIDLAVEEIRYDVQKSNGPVNSLLQDSLVFLEIHSSLRNILKGTESFNQNMEALKHNFLLRGYFKKQARIEQKKADKLIKQ